MANIQLKILTDSQGNDYLKYVPSTGVGSVNLTGWVCESHFSKIIIKNGFGDLIKDIKVSVSTPVDTQNGTRTTPEEVRADIGQSGGGAGASYNETLGADQVYPIHGLSDQYTDFETHVTEQDLTSAYVDFGSVIDMRGFTVLGTKVIWDSNDSQDVDLKIVGCDADGTNEYELNTVDIWRLWTGAGTDNILYNAFDIGSNSYIKIQVKAGTVGTTAGDLTIMINKIWRT